MPSSLGDALKTISSSVEDLIVNQLSFITGRVPGHLMDIGRFAAREPTPWGGYLNAIDQFKHLLGKWMKERVDDVSAKNTKYLNAIENPSMKKEMGKRILDKILNNTHSSPHLDWKYILLQHI